MVSAPSQPVPSASSSSPAGRQVQVPTRGFVMYQVIPAVLIVAATSVWAGVTLNVTDAAAVNHVANILVPPECSETKSNRHTIQGIDHGWNRRIDCDRNQYYYTSRTAHSHGQRYVALYHNDYLHRHCDIYGNGDDAVSCSDWVDNTNHFSWHTTYGTYGDGHGISNHEMESLR